MKKTFTIILISLGIVQFLFAQQVPLLNQYMFNKILTNPAMSYQNDMGDLYALHRSQWTSMPDAPVNQVLVFSAPLQAKKNGFGIIVTHDKAGLWDQTAGYANYSHAVKLNDDAVLSFGVNVGAFQRRFDYNRVVVKDNKDPELYANSFSRATFDMAFGFNFTWKDFNTGFTGWQLLDSRVKFDDPSGHFTKYITTKHITWNASYIIKAIEGGDFPLNVIPSIFLRYTTPVGGFSMGAPVQVDAQVVAESDKYGWVFVGYKHGYSLTGGIGAIVSKKLRAGLSYDFLYINGLKTYLGPAAEIFVSYKFSFAGKGNNSQTLY
ncbi:MAG TPA: PorP/SprF family type IX secretion system membrane protein [Bacteroidia bacterium]|nr:PorP/SprF family type IX secretion system membrane protein [Bacteroidia bacterium]